MNFKVGLNFTYNNELYKIIKIVTGGIDTLNMNTGKEKLFRFFEFAKLVHNGNIIIQNKE